MDWLRSFVLFATLFAEWVLAAIASLRDMTIFIFLKEATALLNLALRACLSTIPFKLSGSGLGMCLRRGFCWAGSGSQGLACGFGLSLSLLVWIWDWALAVCVCVWVGFGRVSFF
jgi:hypothetical protein